MIGVVLALVLVTAACGSKVSGTYSNENGFVVLDLRSGGKASLTMMGEVTECTFTVDGDKLTLECKGDKLVFTIHDDGSLTGPGFIGMLRKKK
jgi:hypothetical protein